MFVGNADALLREVSELFRHVDMLTLDLITDIDFSAATILRYGVGEKPPGGQAGAFLQRFATARRAPHHCDTAAVPSSAIMPNLDTPLAWMEEEALRKLVRSDQDRLPLERIALFRDLTEDE